MADFVIVAQVKDFPSTNLMAVKVGDHDVLLAKMGSEVYALGDTCPHRGCSLAEGEIQDESVVCGCHGSAFNVKTGGVEAPPTVEGVPTYQVRVEGDDVLVAV